ncbi:hypothetical protein [Streptomyces silvisoli]|uniref:Glycosyl hydrolase-like 10 domain-containing protein n=1 Tax=Streptomyces silvisoli TaxID=3034235 RepID=A0ABT5ZF87_9ACTN|nr:hypothetical protein [Streptomyces silvisoli]MDF3288485.1 hypothetical protein [Streptomyces silvisoli]
MTNDAVTYEWTAELQANGAPAWAKGTSSGPEGYTPDDAHRDACAALAERGFRHVLFFTIRPAQH